MSGACGNCTLCCTVMKVAMEPPKPMRTPCRHCSESGCGIYSERPEPCRVFQCLWLATQTMGSFVAMPSKFRPDRAGVVLEVNSAGYIIAHSERPGSWNREPIRSWLLRMAARTHVLVEYEEIAGLLRPDGVVEPLQRTGIDPVTNEILYRRERVHG